MTTVQGKILLAVLLFGLFGLSVAGMNREATKVEYPPQPRYTAYGTVRDVSHPYEWDVVFEFDDHSMATLTFCEHPAVWKGLHAKIVYGKSSKYDLCYDYLTVERLD